MTARPRHCCCCSPARRIHGATKQPESRRSTHSRGQRSTTAAAACGLLAPRAPTSRSPPSTCAAPTCPPWSSSTLRARTCVLRRLWWRPVAGGLRPCRTLSMRRGRALRRPSSARKRLRRCRWASARCRSSAPHRSPRRAPRCGRLCCCYTSRAAGSTSTTLHSTTLDSTTLNSASFSPQHHSLPALP